MNSNARKNVIDVSYNNYYSSINMKKKIMTQEITHLKYVKSNALVKEIILHVQWYEKKHTSSIIKKEIMKAYLYSKKAHEWQWRLSGKPYIIHPVKATYMLLDLQPDLPTIQACLLHDVAEDTETTLEDIGEHFWSEVQKLCDWMEKIGKVRYWWEERSIESLRKMFVAMADDLRVIFIKLADRIHNMRTLSYHPKVEKRERIALETLNIYAPIADRLGLFGFKNELEKECFKILHLTSYTRIKAQLADLRKNRHLLIAEATESIKNLLDLEWIHDYSIDYRIKSLYSIYKKMKKKGLESPASLYDIFGIRITVDTVEECYRILWLVHNTWSPLPNRFKDYIALPKTNWYKALHTTVLGLLHKNEKQPAEIQIKTYEMQEYAEIGVAAHFDYKENGSKKSKDVKWVNDLKSLSQNSGTWELMNSLKIDVFNDRIFIFTPKWDSINLPVGSTVIDFAYYLHTEIWDHISVAKVNAKVYPFDKPLSNGDLVEIITDKSKRPNPFWLSFIQTSKARIAIKQSLWSEDKNMHQERGKSIINKHLEKIWLWILDSKFTLLKNLEWTELSLVKRISLLEQVGNFSITPASLVRRILRSQTHTWGRKKQRWVDENKKDDTSNIIPVNKKIVVWWDATITYKLCYCCRRRIPIQIVGHINAKWDITIHNRKCKILDNVNKERLLPAYIQWEELTEISVDIKFEIQDLVGVLHKITGVISEMNLNIEQISQYKNEEKHMIVMVSISVLDYDYLLVDRLLERVALHLWDVLISKEIVKMGA